MTFHVNFVNLILHKETDFSGREWMKIFMIESAKQLINLGESLGKLMEPGDLLFLFGELGAGKTTLTKGIAKGLGVADPITSPTFQLKKTYQGRTVFNHLDLYRLRSLLELDIIEPDELVEEGVTVVEWGRLLLDKLQPDFLEIQIDIGADPLKREVIFKPHGLRYRKLLEEFKPC